MAQTTDSMLDLRVEPFPAKPPGFVWVLVQEGAGRPVDVLRSQQVFDSAMDAMLDGRRALILAERGRAH